MTEQNVILYTKINVETVIECSLCPIIYNNLYLFIKCVQDINLRGNVVVVIVWYSWIYITTYSISAHHH